MNDETKILLESRIEKVKESLSQKSYTDSMRNYLLSIFARSCSDLLTWSDMSGVKINITIE